MKERTPKLKEMLQTGGCAAGRLGFSAIEVTAVAAIIFVMALILVPIVNKRVDDSKKTAAEEDLSAIQKAEEIAYGYTGHYFRLCDLDRPAPDAGDAGILVNAPWGQTTIAALKTPPAYWNGPLIVATETNFMVRSWNGPLLPKLHKDRSISLSQLVQSRPELINTTQLPSGVSGMVSGGPIFLFDRDDSDLAGNPGAFAFVTWPLDPWGNPYLFFGSGFYGTGGGSIALQSGQVKYTSCAVYSLGPDGVAGPLSYYRGLGRAPTSADYFRESNLLGTGDDLVRQF